MQKGKHASAAHFTFQMKQHERKMYGSHFIRWELIGSWEVGVLHQNKVRSECEFADLKRLFEQNMEIDIYSKVPLVMHQPT